MQNIKAVVSVSQFQRDSFCRTGSHAHLNAAVKTIQSCGVTFKIWKDKSGQWDWTSLMGVEKKKLLMMLPEKLEKEGLLHPDNKLNVVKLCKVGQTSIIHTMYFQLFSSLNIRKHSRPLSQQLNRWRALKTRSVIVNYK